MKQLSVGVIGAGILGRRHARVWHEQEETRLVAVVDVDAQRAASVASAYGATAGTDYGALLDNPEVEAVSVVTPDFLHCEPVIACLRAGKDVLVEKPLATDLDEARRMVAAAHDGGRILQVNFSQRFLAEYATIKEIISRGEIGTPVMVQSLKHDTVHVPTEMLTWASRTSPVYFMTSHDLDLIRWYLEAEPVSAMGLETAGVLERRGVAVHDGLQALVRFSSGAVVSFHTSWIHPDTYPAVADDHLEIVGTEGAVVYRSLKRELQVYTAKRAETITFSGPATATEVGGKLRGAFVDSLRLFLSGVRSRTQPMTAASDSLPAVACQVALLESARGNGRTIDLAATASHV